MVLMVRVFLTTYFLIGMVIINPYVFQLLDEAKTEQKLEQYFKN